MQILAKTVLLNFLAVVGLSACQTLDADPGAKTDPDDDVAAVIVNPSYDSRASLQHVVNVALETAVLLADNALTQSSELTIERNLPRSFDSAPVQGRVMDRPIKFNLVKNGEYCILIDERDASRHTLENTRCTAE